MQQRDALRSKNERRFVEGSAMSKHANLKRPFAAHRFLPQEERKGEEMPNIHEAKTRLTNNIGLGRATGLSRVPNDRLKQSPSLVKDQLQWLVTVVKELEEAGLYLVSSESTVPGTKQISKAILDEWEDVLGAYRELTMAVTASTVEEMEELSIPVYEGAADACLLGGNLSFYLSCQTRLLQDMYSGRRGDTARASEFFGYSLLYFGVFHADSCELARLMRDMSREEFASSQVNYAFSAIKAMQSHNGIRFISIYTHGNVRQRTILHPKLEHMRNIGLFQIIRAYLSLSRPFTLALLGMGSEQEFMGLLRSERPDLADRQMDKHTEFIFRIP